MNQSGVLQLLLVRHGESVGNVAREVAESRGAEVIELDRRDPDVPLSELGCEQAAAVGGWLAELPPGKLPTAVYCSPYVRARQTAQIALDSADAQGYSVDERLRDRELGILDMLTGHGVRTLFPQEAQRRSWLGKLYYRPPGGESWTDVIMRLRSFLTELDNAQLGGRVLIFTHDAVIMLIRYVCEGMDEAALLDLARTTSVANASITSLTRTASDPYWQVEAFSSVAHLQAAGTPATEHPGERDVAPR
jgi:broad specificity phosphatase PhoE